MGNNTSKNSSKSSKTPTSQKKVDDLVDLGSVFPNGLYPATEQDYDTRILRTLIIGRKIAPFYKGLSDAPETVTLPENNMLSPPSLPQSTSSISLGTAESSPKVIGRPRSSSTTTKKDASYDPYLERKKAYMEKMKQREKTLYNDAVECPICFLYYPTNINYSRCCDQPICTECFVQIHRPIETPSTPATCPFCMEENYGILYEAPAWSEKFQARSRSGSHSTISGTRHTTSGIGESDTPRRESVSHNNPDVVLVDHIRPDWDKKATVAASPNVRPLSRRNSASAGRSRNNTTLLRAAGMSSFLTRPGRSASSAAATEYNPPMRNVNDMDIEDWMVMEAIRLSLAEQEEFERKEVIKKAQTKQENNNNNNSSSSSNNNNRQPLPAVEEGNFDDDHELNNSNVKNQQETLSNNTTASV